MPLANAGLNTAVTALAGQATYVSLHTGNPGTSGTSEVTGGSPAYARLPVTWGAPASGVSALSAGVLFDVPGGTTVAYFGYWTAATGGTFLGGDQLRDVAGNPASEAFVGQGVYSLTSATLTVAAA
jgi:hypothetical protein